MADRLATVVVAGASLAGMNAAETLRGLGYDGRLIVVGEEAHPPYDRPPLSKEILTGKWTEERLPIRPANYEALEADKVLGVRAEGLDMAGRRLALADGRELAFDGLIIATGCGLRRIDGLPELDGVHYLRRLEDARAIRRAFEGSPRVLVIGGGFIGCEVAASARAAGLDVTLVEALQYPLAPLGRELGPVAAALHRDNGVDTRLGLSVAGLEGGGRVETAVLSDGSQVAADLVVVGVGVRPATDWLLSSGLKLDDGLLCDPYLAAAEGVYGAGDLVRWPNPRYQENLRVEHWTNAVAQGARAAENLLAGTGGGRVFDDVPSFWSDQFGIKIQLAGRAAGSDEMRVVAGSTEERKFVGLYRRGEELAAVVAFKQARRFIEASSWLAEELGWGAALERAERAFG